MIKRYAVSAEVIVEAESDEAALEIVRDGLGMVFARFIVGDCGET